ncbi:MAG TPA: IclR family transcriptional regulator [Bacillota bacterium]|nr:IclR family transcriptional regulator [Bacillota bacterium]
MNQSVKKALAILDLFTEHERELTLQEIATKANMPKPTAYRLLSTLEAGDFLYKTKETKHDSRYRLGLKLLELGELVSDRLELRKIALPFMQSLAGEINEVVHLVVVNQLQAVYVEKVDNNRALRLNTRIGKSAPLHIGSGPKLLLAYLSESEIDAIFSETLYCKDGREILDKDVLLAELENIRKQGYSYSIGEQDTHTTGISYPIYNFKEEVIASLAVSGLSTYYEGDNLTRIKKHAEKTAKEISEELGYREE